MPSVLVVEDSVETQCLIARALPDFRLATSACLAEARAQLARERPDLVVLDVSLPDGEGFALCSELQNQPETRDIPVLFLSARSHPRDKIHAFGLGAEDYVVKPFDAGELRARVESRIRKSRERTEHAGHLEWEGLRIELASCRGYRRSRGREVDLELTPREFRLLFHLAARPGRVHSRAELRRLISGDVVISDRTVDTHVSNLRRKLGPLRGCVESARGFGYRFRPPDPRWDADLQES